MDEQIEFLKWIATKLASARILYMVTGSMAMNFYSAPRMTRDVDLVVELGPNDVDKVVNLFADECYIEPVAVQDAVRSSRMFNVIHNTWVMKADFIIRKNEPYRLHEFERRRQVDVEGNKIWMVAQEDLVLSKLVWAKESESELQLRDARQLAANVASMDWDYMREWSRRLGLESLLESISNE